MARLAVGTAARHLVKRLLAGLALASHGSQALERIQPTAVKMVRLRIRPIIESHRVHFLAFAATATTEKERMRRKKRKKNKNTLSHQLYSDIV